MICKTFLALSIINMLALMFLGVFPIRVSIKRVRLLWICLTINFAVFCFFIEPNETTDLYRHYLHIKEIQQGTTLANFSAGPLFIYYFLLNIVANVGYHGFLPSITILSIGILIDKIIKVQYAIDDNNISVSSIIMYYFTFISCIGLFVLVSGIRNAFVCTLCLYAYYKYYNHKKLFFYLTCIFASFIHLFPILIISLIAVYEILMGSKKKLNIIIPIVFSIIGLRVLLSTGGIYVLSDMIPGEVGRLLTEKIMSYRTTESLQVEYNASYVLKNVLVLLCLIYSFYKDKKQDKLVLFIYAVSVLGGLGVIIGDRLLMFVAILLLPVISIIHQSKKAYNKTVFKIFIYSICFYEIFYSFYSMCAHCFFDGVNYRNIIVSFLELK